jgi:hypothetical protein
MAGVLDTVEDDGITDFDPIDQIEVELSMIRYTLLLNPENKNLSPDEFEKLVTQEYQDSQE